MREGLVVCSSPPSRVSVMTNRTPTLLVPTPSRFAAGIAKLPADIRKYRERVFGGPPCVLQGGIGEKRRRRARQEGAAGLLVPYWPAALKTLSNEAEDGYWDVGFLEGSERGWRREREERTQRRRDVFTEQFGTKSPL